MSQLPDGQPPSGRLIFSVAEFRAPQIRCVQERVTQIGIVENRAGKIGFAEVGSEKIGLP